MACRLVITILHPLQIKSVKRVLLSLAYLSQGLVQQSISLQKYLDDRQKEVWDMTLNIMVIQLSSDLSLNVVNLKFLIY